MINKIFNKDNSFFIINSKDIDPRIQGLSKELQISASSVTDSIEDDVISFNITEEMGKPISGTLTLKDENQIYSRIFRSGMKLNIIWGYKNWSKSFKELGNFLNNPNEMLGNGIRRGLECVIQQPSGSGDEKGLMTYSAMFYANHIIDDKKHRVFDWGIERDVIIQLFFDLGVTDPFIDFKGQTNKVNTASPEIQRKGSYALLLDIAFDTGAIFNISYDQNGKKMGLFVDQTKLDSSLVKSFLKKATGAAIGSQRSLYYNAGNLSNVISYSWKQNIGESAQGDAVRVDQRDGQLIFTRFRAEDQKIVTWKINKDKIARALAKDITLKKTLGKAFVNVTKFEEIKQFFIGEETVTAPQSMGYGADLRMKGDPLLTMPVRMIFKNGFPSVLTQGELPGSIIKFYLRKASHSFSKSGYFTNINVSDSYTQTGTFIEQGRRIAQ